MKIRRDGLMGALEAVVEWLARMAGLITAFLVEVADAIVDDVDTDLFD